MAREMKVGKPRLDPNERLRHRFYEPLLLLRELNSTRSASSSQPVYSQHPYDFVQRWREFLDSVSLLCDFRHGGATVSSVAAQETPEGSRFWLACMHQNALPHLRWIMTQLEKIATVDEDERKDIARQIAEKSIEKSRDKVKKYYYYFTRALVDAHGETLSNPDIMPTALIDALANLGLPHESFLLLCQAASSFSEIRALDRLVQETTQMWTASPWSAVRHYLLRLRTWHSKSQIIVSFARQFPAIFQGQNCEWLRLPGKVSLPPVDEKTNLLSALQRMVPSDSQDTAEHAFDAIQSLRGFEFSTSFTEAFQRDPKLAVHAEVFLMEYFHFERFQFVGNDRYIGCSKPSCYCCSLYMRYHPGNFVVRPSHGTAWITWCPPLQSRIGNDLVRKHNLFVMNKVIEHLRRDVFQEIENRFPRRDRRPDSTSGLLSDMV